MNVNIYLDDERPCPPGWVLAKTAAEAINLLQEYGEDVFMVSLDHDLGFPVEEKGTGYEVICWLEERAHAGEYVPEIILHTANPAAMVKMGACYRNILRIKKDA